MNTVKIPRPLMYVRIDEDTFNADIVENYNVAIYNMLENYEHKKMYLYLYDVQIGTYRKIEINESEKEMIGTTLIVCLKKGVKDILIEFKKQIWLPEINMSHDPIEKTKVESNNLVKYPIQIDRYFEGTIKDYIKDFTTKAYDIFSKNSDLLTRVECAITLDSDEKIISFINDELEKCIKPEDKFTEFWYRNYVSRVYLGSQFCGLKANDINILEQAVLKCYKRNINVTINTSIVTEAGIVFIEKLLEVFDKNKYNDDFMENMEFTVNDYAILNLFSKKNTAFKCNLGVLFNRRQKDPRAQYRWHYETMKPLLFENELNVKRFPEIVDFYNQFELVEYESNPIGNTYIKGRSVLHFPFYQTNTSRYCPMNAAIVNGDSNIQYNVKKCQHFCERYFYQYSGKIPLIGIGNSNFGIYDKYYDIFREIMNGNVSRIVWDIL